MVTIRTTSIFKAWYKKLKRPSGQGAHRGSLETCRRWKLRRRQACWRWDFGDADPRRTRIPAVFGRAGDTLYVLLLGGDKSSQERDISYAKEIWAEIRGSNEHGQFDN